MVQVRRIFENGWYEHGCFYEDFSNTKKIKFEYHSLHNEGFYNMFPEKVFLEDKNLEGKEKKFYDMVLERSKKIRKELEKVLAVKKEFEIEGKLPPWKRSIAPVIKEAP